MRVLLQLPLLLLILFATTTTIAVVVHPFDQDLIVNTHQGRVQGVFDPVTAGNALSWKGIPYAAPPMRFQPTLPPPHRGNSVLQADVYGPPCLQKANNVSGNNSTISSDLLFGSENCLYLNIWVPGKRRTYFYRRTNNDRLPVIIAFHNGRQASGSGNDTSIVGNIFAAHHEEAIWVSFNYRLGVWGFLALAGLTNEQGFSGAYGALDQLEAVRWVKNNIKFFGGNPDKIMLYGVGGGGVGVATLLASASATNLFHSVLIESPYVLWQKPLEKMEILWGDAIDSNLSCGAFPNIVDCVRNVSNAELCDALYNPPIGAPGPPQPNAPWDPALFPLHHFVAPAGGFLPDSILNILKNNPPNRDVTVLIGGSANESAWYKIVNPYFVFTYDQAIFFTRNYLLCNFPYESSNSTALSLATTALVSTYGGDLGLLFSDGAYTCSIVAMLNCSKIGGSNNWYHFHINRTSPLNNWVPHHASGNPFWTCNMHIDKYGHHRIPNGDDFCLKHILTHFLSNTARNADPNNAGIPNINQIQQWPKWTREDQHHLFVKDCPSTKNGVPFAAYERCRTIWSDPFSLIP